MVSMTMEWWWCPEFPKESCEFSETYKSGAICKLVLTRKYPLHGCLLGPPGWPEGIFFRGGQTDADGTSGAINVI